MFGVETSDGKLVTFGFGPNLDWVPSILQEYRDYLGVVSPGQIDEGNGYYANISGAHKTAEYALSLQAGDQLVQGLRNLANDPPIYGVAGIGGINCREFTWIIVQLYTDERIR